MDLNKTTLSEQIYAILRSDILTGKIPLGEKLTLKNLKTRVVRGVRDARLVYP